LISKNAATLTLAGVLAQLGFAQAAFAQDANDAGSPNPVEEQEVGSSQDGLPQEGSGQTASVAPQTVPIEEEAESKPAKWDISNPPGFDVKQVPIQTDEGSWMDVDVAPDGRSVTFSLLGDIYTMPISGGTPTRIAEGLAWEVQPRFSPDGARIAFTSDRGGGDNIWVMNVDGSDKRQVTQESFRLLNQPTWSPDGRYIAAKKHFTTTRSAGTGEIWIYHASGGGGVALVERPNPTHQKELGEPIYAPDGKAIYYTRNVSGGGTFIYAQDSTQSLFEIEKYEIATGEVTTAVSGYGGSVRPAPSPDGRSIAFVRRDKDSSELWVKDIASGQERMIYAGLDLDLQETWAVYGLYPLMDWMPNSQEIVFWAGGKLRRIAASGGAASIIPFQIDDTRGIADAPHPIVEVSPDSFTTKLTKYAALSPDGSRVVFESLGKLYVKDTRGGTARRLTRGGNEIEAWPAWSRDGRKIAFVRWSDAELGEIVTVSANGSGARTVTSMPGHYAVPQFSPDGSTIVFEKRAGGYLTSPEFSEDPGIYRVAASGGTPVLVSRGNNAPQFGADNDRIFMLGREAGKLQLLSSDFAGEATRVHAVGDLANDFRVSPDGLHLAFRQNYEAFAMPMLPGGQAVSVGEKASSLPVTRASSGGANYIGWSGDGTQLYWSMGPQIFSAEASALFPSAPAAAGEELAKFTPPETGLSLARTVRSAKPSGIVAFTNARILTMAGKDAGVIANGTIIIRGDRIIAVGPSGEIAVPAGAKTVDASGKVIMPGIVDAHAHGPQGTGDFLPQQNWSTMQDLAMGVTTIHDPSNRSSMIFAAAERQRAGLTLAPRIFSTGEIIYGAKAPSVYARIDTYDDALAHVRRIKAQGGMSVKNYNQPRREQRQQVVAAARAENMLVVAEGGSLFGMDMNMIADGNSTMEHNIPIDVMYEDVLQFFAASQTNYTPTLTVTYGGLAADPYWRQATDVFDNPLLVHTPPRILTAGTARRTKAPDWAFVDDNSAREARKLAQRGVAVSIGAHGQQPGVAAHWEMWSFARGGMSPIEALRAGTIEPARSLGMERDIGSLEVGKLADLVVLTADPSADIRNSDKIEQVMLGGRLYDAATMNETVTGNAQRLPYWWE
jgi:imidazolonepropionase-like amidohydrolase/Tol biopolymer transport system component